MDNLEILRKLFDDKIVTILNMFLDNPQEDYSLTQISDKSGVNNATTLRILSKLMAQDIVELNKAGKSKIYRLKPSQKTFFLNMMINKEYQISEFIDLTTGIKGIEKILLDSRTKESAKLIFVTSLEIKDKLESLVKTVNDKGAYKISFIEINEKQFSEMEKFGFELSQKIIWEKPKHS